MRMNNRTQTKTRSLVKLLKENKTLLILLQDNPDPDSIAAAMALRKIANVCESTQCYIAHGGTIGRAENRALVRYLAINLHKPETIDFAKFDLVAMTDTQPGTGNNSMPPGLLPDIVIDHHPIRRLTKSVPFSDVRSGCGATCTILTEYLAHLKIAPDIQLATALLYGIRSDTQDLGRNATRADVRAFEYLYPLANKRMLSEIQRGEVPREYYQMLANALRNARICGKAVITSLGPIDNPDMIAEVADLLLREETTSWAMCTGSAQDKLLISIRTTDPQIDAGAVMRRLVSRRGTGGGHPAYAGGQIPLRKNTKTELADLDRKIRDKFLAAIGCHNCKPEKLIQL